MSPPTRGRGLKHGASILAGDLHGSPPTRGRGLKLDCRMCLLIKNVAPHAGAWIETDQRKRDSCCAESPPTRGRGLKPEISCSWYCLHWVAPHAGAWIETSLRASGFRLAESPPRTGKGKLGAAPHTKALVPACNGSGQFIQGRKITFRRKPLAEHGTQHFNLQVGNHSRECFHGFPSPPIGPDN